VLRERLGAWLRGLSIFEKVIIANSAIICLDTLLGWWITQHDPETYHYLIDTAFITLAVLVGLAINFALLRAAFAPLHAVMTTIRAVEEGNLEARAEAPPFDADADVLARAFNGMLDRLNRLRDETASRVLQAQERERRRLALELHDQTGQSLTALSLHISAVAARIDGETSEAAVQARSQLVRLGELVEATLGEVQALARQLRPPLLDDMGLVAALRWLAQDGSERLGTRVNVRLGGAAASAAHQLRALSDPEDGLAERGDGPPVSAPVRLPLDIETALYRIAQESLTNAVRHGRASHVAFFLRRAPSHVSLLIADDGQGFDWDASARRHAVTGHGMGLDGMDERARLAGGHLAMRSRPGHGCAVRVSIPLAPATSEQRPDATKRPRLSAQSGADVAAEQPAEHPTATAPAGTH
jgi:two-component system sensor histidine kinase UhpB